MKASRYPFGSVLNEAKDDANVTFNTTAALGAVLVSTAAVVGVITTVKAVNRKRLKAKNNRAILKARKNK